MTLRVGYPVANLTFVRPDGGSVGLPAYPGPPLLVIFLRHLA